jgi:uncharacterized protein
MKDAYGHVGRGWAFPLGVDAWGRIAMVEGGDEIDASIRMILSTAPGERVMRPDFGCEIWDLVFAPMEPNTFGMMEYAVRRSLMQWEPRAELKDVRVCPAADEDGMVDIRIDYAIKATNDMRNLVYPFYVIPKEGQHLVPVTPLTIPSRTFALEETA